MSKIRILDDGKSILVVETTDGINMYFVSRRIARIPYWTRFDRQIAFWISSLVKRRAEA